MCELEESLPEPAEFQIIHLNIASILSRAMYKKTKNDRVSIVKTMKLKVVENESVDFLS